MMVIVAVVMIMIFIIIYLVFHTFLDWKSSTLFCIR